MSLDVTKIGVERLYFFIDLIDSEDLYSILLDCYQFVVIIVEEQDLVHYFFVGSPVETFA